MSDAEKLRLAVETLRKYADPENWGHAEYKSQTLFDLWWPKENGFHVARQTLKEIGEGNEKKQEA